MHVALAGDEPFSIYLLILSTDNKIKSYVKSEDSHYQTITGIFLGPNKDILVTTSMDTLIILWTLDGERQNMTKTATATTKNGAISNSVQDKTGYYFVLGHCNSPTDKRANITIWHLDDKKVGITKVAQNVPLEANEENLTALILSHD